MDDGPLLVTGRIPITRSDGATDQVRGRAPLCRCGESANKPYCDGSHVTVGFTDSYGPVSGTGTGEGDQIASGPEDEPRWSGRWNQTGRPAWSLWGRQLGAAAVLAAAAVWLSHQVAASDPHPASSPVTSATSATSTAVAVGAPTYVAVGEICPPVTDGVHNLVVSFTLRNIASVPVTVRSVQPLLPLGGLDTVATDISGGTCGATTGSPAGLVLPVRGHLVVTFRFRLPGTCPQALPIQARTIVLVSSAASATTGQTIGASQVQDDVGVFDDLGAIRFDTCPAPP